MIQSINKDKLLRYLLNQKDTMYRKYGDISYEIDNADINLGEKLSEQSQLSYGIDIISAVIDKLDEFVDKE